MNTTPSFPKRIAALLYDFLLCLACLFVFIGIVVTINKGLAVTKQQQPFVSFGLFFIIFLYFVGFWRQGGQTPGMKVWRIKLVCDEPPANLNKLIIRFFIATFSLGLSFLYCFFNQNGLALHDKLSKTSLRNTPKPVKK